MKGPQHEAEMLRRTERRFVRARDALGCGNLNDLKWYEVFRALGRQREEVVFRMKMVGDERIWSDNSFRPVNQRWTDSNNGPFLHRHIEWLEVTGLGAESIQKSLEMLGKLPIVHVNSGFRLQAYGLLHEASEQQNEAAV
jgi:hypothetical protein